MTALYKNVPVLDSGARGSTTTFVQRGIGDVLLAWENEAYLALAEAKGQVRDRRAVDQHPRRAARRDRRQGRRPARARARSREAYLEFLYTPEAQEIVAKHHYRPRDPKVAAKYAGTFAKVTLFTIDEAFGGWQAAQKTHFADKGTFDQIYRPGR